MAPSPYISIETHPGNKQTDVWFNIRQAVADGAIPSHWECQCPSDGRTTPFPFVERPGRFVCLDDHHTSVATREEAEAICIAATLRYFGLNA